MQITECKEDVLHMSLHTRPACNVNLGLGLSSSSSSAALPSSTSTASPAASSSISMASPSAKPPPAIAMPAAVHLAYAQQPQTPFQSRSLLDHEQAFLRQTPVQLDLLPLGPASTFKNAQAAPPPTASLSAAPPQAFMWQQRLMPSNLMNNIQPPMRGIDVNQIPSSADYEDVVGETSPTGMFSSMATESMCRTTDSGLPLKRERDRLSDLEQERTCEVSSRASDEEAEGGGTRKKLRLSKEQSALLEESFKEHPTLNPKQKAALAKQLSLRPRQVEVWFQNRRARTKLKQTEVDCELLKRCCESLTEENRRLLKEVQELRAIKVAPPCVIAHDLYMPLPAATLTMCPSCAATTTTGGSAGGAGRMSGVGNAPGNAAAAFHAANVKSGLPVSLPSALPLPLPVPTHHHHHHQQPLSQPSAAC